jgi:hypothetical protein
MDIRIDESGGFIAQGPGANRISAVGALVLPSRELDDIYSEYTALRTSFPQTGDGEVKGSGLSESDVAATISLLERFDVLFEAVVSDVASHRRRDIVGFQQQQVDVLRRSVGEEHHPELVEEVNQMATSLRKLSPQLFVQHQMTLALLDRVLRHAPLYLVQRKPEELGSFTWIVDAKGDQLTTYEKLWSQLILPSQQARTARDPHPIVEGADYSHFERFLLDETGIGDPPYEPLDKAGVRSIDGRKLLMDLSFEDSRTELGLELVDVATNALARALNGHLKRAGWTGLGRLMIRKRSQTLRMVAFKAQKADHGKTYFMPDRYRGVVQELERTAKALMAQNVTL